MFYRLQLFAIQQATLTVRFYLRSDINFIIIKIDEKYQISIVSNTIPFDLLVWLIIYNNILDYYIDIIKLGSIYNSENEYDG